MKHFFLLFFAFGVCSLTGLAQTGNIQQDTITWSASADTNLAVNEKFTRPSTFVSYGLSKIELVKGTKARVFLVTSTEGDWTDVTSAGSMIYHVLYADQPGLITLARDENGLTLTLDMSQSSPDGIHNQYSIDHYTVR